MKKLLLPFLFAFTSLAQPSRVVLVSPPLQDPLINSTDLADFRSRIGIPTVAATNLVFVNTISDVAAYVRTDGLPEFIATKGFAAVGDRGGAVYQWINSSAATNIYRIACPSGGRWVETDYLNGWVCNVLKAGATPFDTTDDTAAIQRAFDAAAQQSSGSGLTPLGDEPVVYFPAGKYYLNNTVQYAASSRSYANIAIRGDGIWNTHLIANASSFPEGGNKPLLYIQNVRLNISDLRIRATLGIPKDYHITGLHLKDCDYGIIRDVAIGQFSRGIVVDCGAMNWNTFRGLQFESNFIDVFAAGAQGLTGEWHSTGSGHTWFGPANGLLLDVHSEGAGVYSEFTPAVFYIPAGTECVVNHGYNEASDASIWLGVPLTNRVTIAVNGTTATMTFTNAHYYSTGYTFTIQAEQSVPQDIQDYIVGSRTVVSCNRTNNYLTFTTGGTVTSDPSPYTFLAILDDPGHIVSNSKFVTRGSTYKYLSFKEAIIVDRAIDVEILGQGVEETHVTKRARNVKLAGTKIFNETAASETASYRLPQSTAPPVNIFPDPWLVRGTNWGGPARHQAAYANFTPTNYLGMSGFLFHITNKPISSYSQYGLDFTPLVPMSSLNGRRLKMAAVVFELNHPSWKPTAWTINNAGSGYSDGTATVSADGRDVQVTLTTSAGAITGVTWYWNTFTSTNVSNLSVVQTGGSGGVITPTAFSDFSAWTMRDSRGLTLRLKYRGETLGQTGVGVLAPAYTGVKRPEGDIRYSAIAPLDNLVDGSKPGFRLILVDSSLGTANAVGTEAYFVAFIGLYVEGENHRSEYALHNWFRQPAEWVTGYRSGIGYSPVVENGLASILATNDVSSVTTLGLVTSGGGSGLILHYIGAFTADPSGTFAVGSVYRNTSTSKMRFWTGSAWTDF